MIKITKYRGLILQENSPGTSDKPTLCSRIAYSALAPDF